MSLIINWAEPCAAQAQNVTVVTPAGRLRVTVRADTIVNTDWLLGPAGEAPPDSAWQRLFDAFWQDRKRAVEIKLLQQGSPFRRRVWTALAEIPCGETRTYAELARALASSPRAVGNACRDNPYAPLIPCHRVVSAAGPGGYCGATGGALLDIKLKLLHYEAEICR